MNVIVSHNLNDREHRQVRFPRSKRRRIRKKWSKNPRNWRTTIKPVSYVLGARTLVCNPVAYAALQRGLRG